jgi:hypothetical protein
MTNKQKQRYTAFIDILGFQRIISNTENEPDLYEKIEITLTNISNIDQLRKMVRSDESDPDAVVEFEKYQDLHVQAFSDCILISAADNEIGLLAVTAMSALTYWMLFSQGFFARGAITKDELTHDNNIVFGKALVRAYSLEQKVAIFPRIILSKEIADEITNKARHIPIKVDFDGQPFLDIFHPQAKKIINTWNEKQLDKKSSIKLENGSQELINQIETINDPSIQQKLNWLRNYLNNCAKNLDLNEI